MGVLDMVSAIEADGREVLVIDVLSGKVLVHWADDHSYIVWNVDSRGNTSLGKYYKYFSLLPAEQVQARHDAYAKYLEVCNG